MSNDQQNYTPSDEQVRVSYMGDRIAHDGLSGEAALAEWTAFLARVRRDAVEQFIEACKEKRDAPGFLLPVNYFQDLDATIRVAESYVKNYPETGDQR